MGSAGEASGAQCRYGCKGFALRLLNPRDVKVTISKGTAVAELEGVAAGIGSVPPGDVGVAVISDGEAAEPTAKHRQTLWEMVEQSEYCLGQGEKEQLFALLLEYHNLFATGSQDLGQTGRVKHKVDTGTALPIRTESLTSADRKPSNYWMTY